jgi:hypothetical protein
LWLIFFAFVLSMHPLFFRAASQWQ